MRSLFARVLSLVFIVLNGPCSLGSIDVDNEKKENINLEIKEKYERFYITKTGRRYHRDGCIWLGASKILVTKEYIKEHKIKPCKLCCSDLQDKALISLKETLKRK